MLFIIIIINGEVKREKKGSISYRFPPTPTHTHTHNTHHLPNQKTNFNIVYFPFPHAGLPFCLCCPPRTPVLNSTGGGNNSSSNSCSSGSGSNGLGGGSSGSGGGSPVSSANGRAGSPFPAFSEQRTSSVAELRRRAREHTEAMVAGVSDVSASSNNGDWGDLDSSPSPRSICLSL